MDDPILDDIDFSSPSNGLADWGRLALGFVAGAVVYGALNALSYYVLLGNDYNSLPRKILSRSILYVPSMGYALYVGGIVTWLYMMAGNVVFLWVARLKPVARRVLAGLLYGVITEIGILMMFHFMSGSIRFFKESLVVNQGSLLQLTIARWLTFIGVYLLFQRRYWYIGLLVALLGLLMMDHVA